ncbi:uncharacterized protein FPOAC1_014060 [Fusarium poae]|uniref:uncharacterized protein n=1 Tax=Fusarium poae TaxID=36050 RepID=UPI001D04FB6A|nr:uncharacterized protein FPOAC1_014090 [Fusarium poae]XP_044700670.1 uncharacterized protein FPOAC1_014060 [Fusarium poae]KAG8664121.1 hypothetical protein FPOAC1_014090 [Fusarium poae]KAG8664167.1 hypothetical protein FPOAC1_014060 [Fusarium poae]
MPSDTAACGSSYLSVGATDAVEDDAIGDVPPCVDGFADDTADDAAVSILTIMQLVLSLPDPACPDNPDDGFFSGFPSCKDDIDVDTAAAGRASPDNAGESATGIASSTCADDDDKYKIPLYR